MGGGTANDRGRGAVARDQGPTSVPQGQAVVVTKSARRGVKYFTDASNNSRGGVNNSRGGINKFTEG